jgi:hypothetical protein
MLLKPNTVILKHAYVGLDLIVNHLEKLRLILREHHRSRLNWGRIIYSGTLNLSYGAVNFDWRLFVLWWLQVNDRSWFLQFLWCNNVLKGLKFIDA